MVSIDQHPSTPGGLKYSSRFPPDTKQKEQELGEWFGAHTPHDVAAALPSYVGELQAAYPDITSWGILGYCWGGKVVELVTSSAENPFSVAAVAHPAMLDATDADKITVPFALLASGEEPAEKVQQFRDGLRVPCHVESFPDQVHGFMAARANLADERVRAEYIRWYEILLRFFGERWG